MHVSITGEAIRDLDEIEDFISKDNVAAAAKWILRLEARIVSLANSPRIGKKRDDVEPGLRTITEGNYVICYRILDDEVQVGAIVHTSRQLKELLSRRN
jgi:toxin ParE1/3/4